jgi:hypothetical protein
MRLATALFALFFASNAYAGGVGVFGQGGVYQERLYYHRADPRLGTTGPFQEKQLLPMGGLGLEVLLGDRDDKIAGIARVYYQAEGAQPDPSGKVAGNLIVNRRETMRHVGVFSVGLQGGLIGNPDTGMLTVLGLIGSGFLTNDHTEFVFGEFGVGGTYRLNRSLELHGSAMGHVRFRKWARGGATGVAGIRVLFD